MAKGIDVKSWSSSNTKVCKVEKQGSLGILATTGVGKCTITCTAKNGKKYQCRLTVVGGKGWGDRLPPEGVIWSAVSVMTGKRQGDLVWSIIT